MNLRSASATAAIISVVLLLQMYSGARSYAQQSMGQLLISSGFNPIAATTPEMVNRLMSFPPNQFQLRQKNGRPYYVYADPANNQVFVGTPSQYQKYQQLRLANNLAQDQLQTAQLNSWGPGLWGFPE